MPQKKKKHNQQANQKVLEAQHRNDFFKRLSIFSKVATGENVLALLPEHEWERIYLYRTRFIMPLAEEGCDIPCEKLSFIKCCLNLWFKQSEIPLVNITRRVIFSDYYEFSISLYVLYHWTKSMNHKNAQKVNNLLLDDFGDLNLILKNLLTEIYLMGFLNLTVVCNDFCQNFYTFRIEEDYDKNELRFKYKIFVKPHPIESEKVVVEGNPRPAYRVGWSSVDGNFNWLEIDPSQLGIKNKKSDNSIPVYIQKHALQRLKERLDSIHPNYLNYHVTLALQKCNVVRSGSRFLIEYQLFKEKVGYLVATLINGKLIIRTFLFLTCCDTPEGRKLENLLGLKKLDTAFLMMERLSTFMPASLKGNEELRAIFEKIGCSHLLNIHDKLDIYSIVHPQHTLLEMMPQYIKTQEETPIEWMSKENDNDTMMAAAS